MFGARATFTRCTTTPAMAGEKLQWIEGTTARWDGYMEFQRRPDPLTLEQQYCRLTPQQARALAEGLPYQTLIASLLHKYASGRLKET